MFPTRFDSVLDLARLPWFEIEGGNRLIADPAVGPVIDMHSHIAFTYLVSQQVDVLAETPTTHYYLPLTTPLDLDLYSNLNLDAESLFAMKLDLTAMSFTAHGKRSTHTAPNLLRDMDALGIERAVILPFDLPVGASNAEVYIDTAERFPRLTTFGSVHPLDRRFDEKFDRQVSRGIAGMKFHPNGQLMSPDHPKTVRMCHRCGSAGIPVLFHCGPVGIEPKIAERRSQVWRYERAISENPHTTFILGHCGALQSDEALQFATRYDNLYYEVSCLGLPAVARVLSTIDHDRILYGTDWPFYHQAITLARVLMLTEGDEALRRAVLHDNAERLLGAGTAGGSTTSAA